MNTTIIQHFQSKQPSIKERIESGKFLRQKCSRINQGIYQSPQKRTDPVALLIKQGETRLPELVPVRYARMLTSPFAFLRGGAAIMAGDLAANGNVSGLTVQACGDLHVANFGVFASVERNLIFGINDFDETLPGPWEWDLKRLVASLVVAGQFLRADKVLCEEGVRSAVSSYRKYMKKYAGMGNLELWYSTIREKDILANATPDARVNAKKIIDKARQRTHLQVLDKLTDIVDEKNCFREDAPFIVRQTHTQTGTPIKKALATSFAAYLSSLASDRVELLKQYLITDVARKVVGVGSVGTRCWIIFLTGKHGEDPLFLQLKEAQPSVLAPYCGASAYANEGHRVVAGQRVIQAAPDIFLGWGEVEKMHFYVRQLRDMKGGVDFDPTKVKVGFMPQYAALCARATALAHAKSGDAAMLSGYCGNSEELDDAMVKFAFAYARQNEKDYEALVRAAKTGRIKPAAKAE
jgi:uncharacterized protein (DUF2252 family)